jgi:PAS domain S-box-containing protein
MLNLKKSLLLRIAIPILFVVFLHGTLLYFYVLTPISEHANKDIEQDLTSLSRSLYNICNINFDTLLLSGLADDYSNLVIKQALTLGQIEDVFSQENLKGLIYDYREDEVIFNTDLPVTPELLIKQGSNEKKFSILKDQVNDYFISVSNFKPWRWQIIIVKNESHYSTLISNTYNIYLLSFGSLVLVFFFLIVFIYQSINQPVSSIIKNIHMQKKPNYKGIDVFEFLSKTISHMMESIHQTNEKYRILVENSNHLVWEIDLYNRFTFVSTTVTTIMGYLPDEMIGNTPFFFMPGDEAEDAKNDFDKYGIEKLSLKGLISTLIHKDGNHLKLEVNGVPILSDEGKLLGYRGICRDVTERINAEVEKINAQKIAGEESKLALIGRVAGKLAHDFNNILGIIMGNTELALMDCKEEEINKTLQITFEQTLRGKNLTKNLVAFAKDQDIKEEYFKLSDKIDLVIRLLKKDLKGIEVVNENSEEFQKIFADPGMIEHALVNLIQNSIHALSKIEEPKISIITYSDFDNIYFEIEDNGCGIPEEYLDLIFEPSFTLKGTKDSAGVYDEGIKGTGYGMPNVKKYIELHKGNISVESKFGLGTKFIVSLPVRFNESDYQKDDEINNFQPHFEKNILLVEDEQDISDVLSAILYLKPNCHKVDVVDTGMAAIEMFEQNNYDLISLDYVLNGRLNGMDVYNHIRKINKAIPILFLSGNIEFLESIKELKLKDYYIDHLSKPCQNKEYINAVNKLLDELVIA